MQVFSTRNCWPKGKLKLHRRLQQEPLTINPLSKTYSLRWIQSTSISCSSREEPALVRRLLSPLGPDHLWALPLVAAVLVYPAANNETGFNTLHAKECLGVDDSTQASDLVAVRVYSNWLTTTAAATACIKMHCSQAEKRSLASAFKWPTSRISRVYLMYCS